MTIWRRNTHVAVNCGGLDGGALAGDDTVRAYRGQIVRVYDRTFPRLVFIDRGRDYDAEPLYIVPQAGRVVLGGTFERLDAEPPALADADLIRPDPAVTRRILDRCSSLFPGCALAANTEPYVGLRPVRVPLRLEADEVCSLPVVHNYGHGGAGFTLSWGSAERVGELVGRSIRPYPRTGV